MNSSALAPPLLAWFAQNKRVLPFRDARTPYRIWVSEIMLQQTRVSAVLPYYERFMAALPDVAALAACEPERLNKLWEGLGYYSRVRNLQKAARIVMEQYGGVLPADYNALKSLPGIGEYTAGAIASLGFGLPEVAVDGNVLRVFARLFCCTGNVLQPDVKKRLSALVKAHQPPAQAGEYNEALMELGALVCLPNTAPLCDACPLAALCKSRAAGTQKELPVKAPPKRRRVEKWTVAIVGWENRTLLCRRPTQGLLAGLWQPLMLEGWLTPAQLRAVLQQRGLAVASTETLPRAKHVFTHLEWHMHGYACTLATPPAVHTDAKTVWASRDELQAHYTLPNAFRAYKPALLGAE